MKTTRTAAKVNKIADYNAAIDAKRAGIVDAIMTLRPSWKRDALCAVASLYGDLSDPGLYDILTAVQKADALNVRFS